MNFIKTWSVYKDPTFYFDYFHDDRRDMNIKKIIEVSNRNNPSESIDIGEIIDKLHKTSTNLDWDTFEMIDWGK